MLFREEERGVFLIARTHELVLFVEGKEVVRITFSFRSAGESPRSSAIETICSPHDAVLPSSV